MSGRRSPQRASTRAQNQQAFFAARESAREELARQRLERRVLLAAPIPPRKKAHSTFKESTVERIIERISCGETLTEICTTEGMPHYVTVMAWLRNKPDFRKQYDEALELSADFDADMVKRIRIAQLSGDLEPEEAKAAIAASTWLAKVRNRKRYADKADEIPGGNAMPTLNLTLTTGPTNGK